MKVSWFPWQLGWNKQQQEPSVSVSALNFSTGASLIGLFVYLSLSEALK